MLYLSEYIKAQNELIKIYQDLTTQYKSRSGFSERFDGIIDWCMESRWRKWRYLPVIFMINRAYLDAFHPEWKEERVEDDQEAG